MRDLAKKGSSSLKREQAGDGFFESGKQLSPASSKLIRKQLSCVLECRLLAKCLKDIAAKAISGDAPSVDRLLGRRSLIFEFWLSLNNKQEKEKTNKIKNKLFSS